MLHLYNEYMWSRKPIVPEKATWVTDSGEVITYTPGTAVPVPGSNDLHHWTSGRRVGFSTSISTSPAPKGVKLVRHKRPEQPMWKKQLQKENRWKKKK